jgi:hypothetical protein
MHRSSDEEVRKRTRLLTSCEPHTNPPYLLHAHAGRGHCWGNGPAHVGVSGSLYELEGILVNIVSVRGVGGVA